MAKKSLKKKEMTQASLVSVSPNNVGNVSFDKDLELYKNNLNLRKELRNDIAELHISFRDKLNEIFPGTQFNFEGRRLSDIATNIVIYKTYEKTADEQEIEKLAKLEGSSFYEIARNESVMAYLTKKFQPDVAIFIKQAARFYSEKHWADPQVDEERTQAAKDCLSKIALAVEGKELQLKELEDSISNIREYIDVVKDIATITRWPKED